MSLPQSAQYAAFAAPTKTAIDWGGTSGRWRSSNFCTDSTELPRVSCLQIERPICTRSASPFGQANGPRPQANPLALRASR